VAKKHIKNFFLISIIVVALFFVLSISISAIINIVRLKNPKVQYNISDEYIGYIQEEFELILSENINIEYAFSRNEEQYAIVISFKDDDITSIIKCLKDTLSLENNISHKIVEDTSYEILIPKAERKEASLLFADNNKRVFLFKIENKEHLMIEKYKRSMDYKRFEEIMDS